MAECAFCKVETQLDNNGAPVCVNCAEARDARRVPLDRRPPVSELKVREILRQEVLETTATVNAASEDFHALLSAIPSGVPHPDGADRIHQASRRLSAARKEMIKAHSRLIDFLSRGVIPEELNRAAGDST
jgi:hypothetical protein